MPQLRVVRTLNMRRSTSPPHKELHLLLTDIAHEAYRSLLLAANPVLARFVRVIFTKPPVAPSPSRLHIALLLIKRGLQYYVNNGLQLLAFFRQPKRQGRPGAALHRLHLAGRVLVLDSDCFLQRTLDSGTLDIFEIPGLAEEAHEQGYPLVVAATLVGEVSEELGPQLTAILARQPYPVLTPLGACTWTDMARLCWLTFWYPLALGWFLLRLDTKERPEMRAFQHECLETLPTIVAHAFLRHVFGRRLAKLFPQGMTVISWCENRAGDKLFYRGLRSQGVPLEIIGAQLFVYPDNYIAAYITRAETEHGMAPDRLVCNGPGYLPQDGLLPASVGPALRYAGLFAFDPARARNGTDILITLGYSGVREALQILSQVRWPASIRILIRMHPAHSLVQWEDSLPARCVAAQGPLHERFSHCQAVVGAETGALLEALSCGVPVIHLNIPGDQSLGFLPALGKDTVWFGATTSQDVERLLEMTRTVAPETLLEYAERYRQEFFNRPEPGHLLEQFGVSPADFARS